MATKKKTKADLEKELAYLKNEISTGNHSNISHCNFQGVHWDAKALESVQTVAKGLLNLTELFKSQNITINSLLHIGDNPDKTINDN